MMFHNYKSNEEKGLKGNMKKCILLLACAFILSVFFVCFADDDANSGGPTQQTYVKEAVNVAGSSTAGAISQSPVLRDVAYTTQGGRQMIIKLYDVAPNYDVNSLAGQNFEDGGLLYTHKDTIKVSDNHIVETKQACQTVTVSHTEKDNAMGSLQPMLEYSENGFTGQLMLQPESITTTAEEKESYGYTISDTREYPNLDRNDTAYIPKTVEKNGVSLTLAGIDWQAMGNGPFTATASYSGRATGSKVTGYTSKAVYLGEVSKETLDSCTYKVIYEGASIPVPYLQYGLTAGGVLVLLVIFSVIWNKRKNAKIYALLDGEFKIVRRVRISYIDPIVDLTPAAVQSRVSEYIITIDRWATKRLNNQRLRILCGDGMVREQTIVNTGYGYKIHLEAIPIPAAEEYEEDEYGRT